MNFPFISLKKTNENTNEIQKIIQLSKVSETFHLPFKQRVGGSIPPGLTKKLKLKFQFELF